LTQYPTLIRKYGLGADVSGTDPLVDFKLHLALKILEEAPNSIFALMLPPHSYKIKLREVTDQRQAIVIETRYGDTNAWVEWIKYSV
jgi:hypothetical protein